MDSIHFEEGEVIEVEYYEDEYLYATITMKSQDGNELNLFSSDDLYLLSDFFRRCGNHMRDME